MARITAALLALTASAGLGGCAYGYGDGYGGVSVGYGSGGYYDDYYSAPYYGWYDGYYYPGAGYYVYDQGGHRHKWKDHHRRYWDSHRHGRDGRENWADYRRDGDGRGDGAARFRCARGAARPARDPRAGESGELRHRAGRPAAAQPVHRQRRQPPDDAEPGRADARVAQRRRLSGSPGAGLSAGPVGDRRGPEARNRLAVGIKRRL